MISTMRLPRAIPVVLLLAPLSIGASCGESRPVEPTTTEPTPNDPSSNGTNGASGPAEPNGDPNRASAIPMPDMPEARQSVAAAEARTAPRITSVDEAREALRLGFYREVEGALGSLPRGDATTLLRASVLLETGRHREAATAAASVRSGAEATRARTLEGEALLAAGALDEAERVLAPLASNADAHRAHVFLGRLHQRRGRLTEAESAYMLLVDAYNDERIGERDGAGLALVGMAAWGLGSPNDANDAFRDAVREDAGNVEAKLEWARLFFAKYDTGHAEELVREALAINPEHPVAHALMARIVIEQSFDFSRAEEHLERALRGNPNLAMAHVTRAGMALRDLDVAGADAHLDTALAVDPHDLEALSTRAAVRFLADDDEGFRRAKQEVLRRHRTYSELFTIVGEYAEWEHRYPDIVGMMREAVTLRPDDYVAQANLGLNLLRMGDEENGVRALNDAWRRDRFNVRVYNTLNLYDEILPREYESFEARPFTFRMQKDERRLLERYVPRTLQAAWADMTRRYGFTPEGPVRIEMFANPQHFAVRTTGLPNLGVQGVCFGKVVTAISPEGGPFNWGQITWHELAHVFHIQLSRNRVPRWFTEGLAEYETLIARADWKREMDHFLWSALEDGRLPPLRLMNRAFTHARSAMGMMVAYYASTRIVVFLAERFGFAKIPEMLRAWAAGKRTEQVMTDVLGMDVDAVDAAFRAHERQRMAARAREFAVDFQRYEDLDAFRAAATAAPNDAAKQAQLAAALLAHGEGEEAKTVAERVMTSSPNEPTARFVLARIAMATGDHAGAEVHLRAIVDGGRDGFDLRLLLARTALARGAQADAKTALEAATRLDPERVEAWQGLAELARQGNDADGLLAALRQMARIDEHDRSSHEALVAELVRRERWDDVIAAAEAALFVAPASADVHVALARAYASKGRHADALYEADSALVVGAPAGPVQVVRARALQGLGRRNEAREAARAAVEADASLAEQVAPILGR
jgi:tetratricopeptide (TPR) repeat protein